MDEIAHFLSQHPPFSLVPFERVQRIAALIQIEYFAAGRDILVYGGKPGEYLYIIRRGSVDLLHEDKGDMQIFDTLSEGEVFGHPSLIRGKSPLVTVRAREEVLVYLLPGAIFHELRNDLPVFARFFAASAIERLSHALQVRHDKASPELFQVHMGDLIRHSLVTATPETSVREAAQIMHEQNVSSVIVTSTPPGILTDRDLRSRVLAAGVSDSTPVAKVMTSPVVTMTSDSLVFEGLMKMLENRFHHMPITEDGRIVGVVTHTEILRQQSRSPLFLPNQLERANTIEELRAYNDLVAGTAGALLEAGARVRDIGRVIAVAHDALVERLLEDTEAALGAPLSPYAWLVTGSEGRYEQTLRTDQDNALVYADDASPEASAYFTVFAERMVEQLVQCGFPRCPGGVIASNPLWCQPLHVWKDYFKSWIDEPAQAALMRVSIFFDYRQIHGALHVEPELRPIIERGRENRVFLGRLARTSVRQSAPLGFFRNFLVEKGAESRDMFDLKHRGAALIVDIARLFALEAGCADPNTLVRLRLAAGHSSLSASGAEELSAAFELINLLRLRLQYHQMQHGKDTTNQVSISKLSTLERRELKEALVAVARMQRGVEFSFQTELFG